MSMKIHWGTGIAISILIFMSFISFFVYQMMHTKVELVREDYYENSIQYSLRQKKLNFGKQFENDILIGNNLKNSCVEISVKNPEIIKNPVRISFYRSDNRAEDFQFTLQKKDTCMYFINKPKGIWKIYLEGSYHEQPYVVEKIFEY